MTSAMIFKLIGSATVLACGAVYARLSERKYSDELEEYRRLLELIKYMKNEIEEFDTPLNVILSSRSIYGGIPGLLSSLKSERLKRATEEARLLGRGYKKEELRICERLLNRIGAEKDRLEAKAEEERVIARVKGIGASVAAVILLL